MAKEECLECHGRGIVEDSKGNEIECEECEGTGEVENDEDEEED
jgi:DnaJ-class molecular chaperone